MACYISAGHHLKDPGAVANGLKEADLTRKVRDRVVEIIRGSNAAEIIIEDKKWRVITDNDTETLAEYLKRIQPGDGSVVVEFHFDAASSDKASGSSAFYKNFADLTSRNLAMELAQGSANIMDIPFRGAMSESESHRGTLGLTHKKGATCLVEVCFITNKQDIAKFIEHFEELCQFYASTIMKYDDLIK